MVNLEEKIGLPVALDDSGKLSFGPNVEVDKVSVRKLSDLKVVAHDQNVELSNEPAYTMYRNVRLISDSGKIQSAGLRFDLTVIPAAMIGDEYIKTSGHSHPQKPGISVSYPEIYFVLSGEALYLLQNNVNGTAEDVISAKVAAGQYILIPPGYGHVTINAGKDTLVMANLVSDEFTSDYSEYERLGGGAYYYMNKFGAPTWEKNAKYGDVPKIKELRPNQETLGEARTVYGYISDLSKLDFLNNPENHATELAINKIFVT